jgi:phage terminase Nu1 subunit (DNA packaging protein)
MNEQISLPDDRRGAWLPVKELAAVFGITPQGFRVSYLGDISPGDIRQGKPLRVYAPAAIQLHVERAIQRAGGRVDDEIDAGPMSPALERWRLARAKSAEVELLRHLGELEAVAQLRSVHLEVLAHVRRFAERMIKTFGTVPAEDWEETTSQIDSAIGSRLRLDARRRELHVWPDDASRDPVVLDLSVLGTEGDEGGEL